MTGKELKKLRSKYGISQTKFAKMLALETRGSVSRLEHGACEIPKRVVVIIRLLEDKRKNYSDMNDFIKEVEQLLS